MQVFSTTSLRRIRRSAREWFVRRTRGWVWQIAGWYDLRVDRHCAAQGQNPLLLEDDEAGRREHIPRSVTFNTRSGRIVVGRDTVFGEEVMLLTGKHYNLQEAQQAGVPLHYVPLTGRDIHIGSGCYIGSGAIILGGVKIGDHAVVGAGAVVTHDVPARTFVAGVPARVIRQF